MSETLSNENSKEIRTHQNEQNNTESSITPETEKQIIQPRIPEMILAPSAPELDETSLGLLKEQWKKFWELRERIIFNLETESVPTLKSGDLLHNMAYNPEILKSIISSGIISGQIGFGNKTTTSESETHYCADFFINKETRSIKDFTSYILQKEKSEGGILYGKGEVYKFPFKIRDSEGKIRNTPDSISIVLDGNNSELKDILTLSGTSSNGENISKFISYFPRSDDRHLAVVVGIPANFIKAIIVSPGILADQEKLQELKNIISESGLQITITDSDGIIY